MDVYALYRASLERALTVAEREQLDTWLEETPSYALLHLMAARGDERAETAFKAAIYAPNRRQLQQYLRGRLFWPRLVAEPDMEEKKTTAPAAPRLRQAFGQSAPLFVGLDWSQLPVSAPSEAVPFGVVHRAPSAQAYLQQILTEKTLLHLKLVRILKDQISRFKSSQPVEAVDPTALPTSYRPVNREERQRRSAELIDQFLAEVPQMGRKRPVPTPAEQTAEEHAQAKASAQADDNLVTETLAQLYLRQGNTTEAVRIYQELSLRFPHKSSYFAAQIEKISKS